MCSKYPSEEEGSVMRGVWFGLLFVLGLYVTIAVAYFAARALWF